MATHQVEDLSIFYSKLPETALNTPYVLTADFKGGLVNAFMPPLPTLSKFKPGEIGAGNEFGQKGRNGYWQPTDLPFAGEINTEITADVACHAFGGTITNTAVTAASSYDHFVALQTKAQGREPKKRTVGFDLGGYDILFASMAVDAFEITFGGETPPVWSSTLRNAGHFLHADALTPLIVPPTPPTYNRMHPAAVKATFNNGGVIDFAADGRLISGRCGMRQDIAARYRPGTFRISGDRTSGAHANVLTRSKRVYVPELRVSLGDDLADFVTSRNNTDITSLKYLFVGGLIGATSDSYEFEITYPLSTVSVQTELDNNEGALVATFDIDRSDAAGGAIAALRVRNGTATIT